MKTSRCFKMLSLWPAILLLLSASLLSGCSDFLPPLTTPVPTSKAGPKFDIDPTISLQPESGYAGTYVRVAATGWPAGQIVFIAIEDALGRSALLATSIADNQGKFTTGFLYPLSQRWLQPGLKNVLAYTSNDQLTASASFEVVRPGGTETPTAVGSIPGRPTATETLQQSTATPSSTATERLALRATSTAMAMHTSTEAPTDPSTGTSVASRGTPIIKTVTTTTSVTPFPTNTLVSMDVPSPAVTPIPQSTAVSRKWQGSYWNNIDLSGPPALIRDDSAIDFDWAAGSPAVEIGVDNFSVRWVRTLYFEGGTYRFSVEADDGVRLFIDEQLVLESWRVGTQRTLTVDRSISTGDHTVKMEFFEASGIAVASLRWDQLNQFSGWQGEYFDNPNLTGTSVLTREKEVIDNHSSGHYHVAGNAHGHYHAASQSP